MIKNMVLSLAAWIQILFQAITGCVTSVKLLSLSVL